MKKTLLAGLATGLLIVCMAGVASAVPVIGGKIYATGGNIQVTVDPSDSGYTHELWLYSPSSIDITWSKDFGKTVNLGTFAAGTELIFGIYVNIDAGDIFKTGPGSRNTDGLEHAIVDFTSRGVAQVGFEDLLGGGDLDYNDCIFTFNGAIAPSPVPEPAAMLLFGTGIAGLAGIARRKRS